MKPCIRYSTTYGWYVCVYNDILPIPMWCGNTPCAAYKRFVDSVYG